MLGLAVLAAIVLGLVAIGLTHTHFQEARRRRFIASHAFPPALREKLIEHHPRLSDDQAGLVLEGLREWFRACHDAKGKMIGMPSRVVDDAWHEFILMTRLYHEFCDKAFGRYLHHTPNAVADKPIAP